MKKVCCCCVNGWLIFLRLETKCCLLLTGIFCSCNPWAGRLSVFSEKPKCVKKNKIKNNYNKPDVEKIMDLIYFFNYSIFENITTKREQQSPKWIKTRQGELKFPKTINLAVLILLLFEQNKIQLALAKCIESQEMNCNIFSQLHGKMCVIAGNMLTFFFYGGLKPSHFIY